MSNNFSTVTMEQQHHIICRMLDELCAKITTKWSPNRDTRKRGRPRRRWRDEIDDTPCYKGWPEEEQDRESRTVGLKEGLYPAVGRFGLDKSLIEVLISQGHYG